MRRLAVVMSMMFALKSPFILKRVIHNLNLN